MKVLVTSATGTVGSRVVKQLSLQGDIQVFQATRQPKKPGQVFLDFADEQSLERALSQVEKAILITPASPTEMEDGLKFIEMAKKARLQHLIFMSIHQVEVAPHIPHFASKIAMQKSLESSGMVWTTIAPNNFYQNDLWFKQSLLEQNTYPQPFGNVGLNRVDADDIAEALVRAVFNADLAGQIFPLVGPELLTVQDVCRTYSKYLHREILYVGDNLDRWQEANKDFLPDWLIQDWRQMYEFFQKEGLRATAKDFLKQEKILGRAPKNFEQFVKQTVQNWI